MAKPYSFAWAVLNALLKLVEKLVADNSVAMSVGETATPATSHAATTTVGEDVAQVKGMLKLVFGPLVMFVDR
jgi:hypothetical protein